MAPSGDHARAPQLATAKKPWTVAGGHVFYLAAGGGLFVIDNLPLPSR